MSHSENLERATALLRSGKPVDAAAILGGILAREPRHAVAAHLLGLALKDTGDLPQGEEWLRFSIGLEPHRGEFHCNLGNLLRKRQKYPQAEAAYRDALERLPQHRAARRALAQTLNDLNRPSEAEVQCRLLLASDGTDAEAWEILALALGGLGHDADAEKAHRRAVALNPADAIAHHNLGALLASLERPEAKTELDTARKLGADGRVAAYNSGQAALNDGDLAEAEAGFEHAARLQPLSVEAQRELARVRFMRGDPAFARTLGEAVRANRDNVPLQRLLARLLWRAGELAAAETLLRDLLARKGPIPAAQSMLAMVLLDMDRLEEAETFALEAAAARPDSQNVTSNLVTILIARARPEEAQPFITAQLRRDPLAQAWLAFEATAARMLGTERYPELCDYERFVQVFDLQPPRGFSSLTEFHHALTAELDDRHRFAPQLLDQPLRNGTRTVRSLTSTGPDRVVQAMLGAFEAPIEQYRCTLELPPGHPLIRARDGAIGLTGAWSVRLRRDGFHVNHVHPEGVVSSAYYVEVPEEARNPALKAGWIKFGEPRYPVAGLGPERVIQPRPGRLVLFPSYMWHGTNPIHGAEPRTCVAFDMRPRTS